MSRVALKPLSSQRLNSTKTKNDFVSKIKKDRMNNKSTLKRSSNVLNNRTNDYKIQEEPSTSSLKMIGGFFRNAVPTRVPVNNIQTPRSSTSSSSHSSLDIPDETVLFDQSHFFSVNGNQYFALKKIGKGGSSKVYKVMSEDSQIYALKRVCIDERQSFDTFVNEIALLKRLQKEYHSERIISLIDSEINYSKNTILIVLELGDIDLRGLIEKRINEKKKIDPNFLRLMWQQMLEAVQVVHKANVVHGDLKPANFLFVKGKLKLIDFGIAKRIAVENDTTNIERTNQVGTLNYMPPESLKMNENCQRFKVGISGDVWSLGCILYQLVYGQPPFPQTNLVQKIQAIVDETYEIEFPEIPDRLDFPDLLDTMKSCLQRNPKARPKIEDLLNHPYLTFSPKKRYNEEKLGNDILFLINRIQEDYQDVPFDSQEMKTLIKKIANNFDKEGRLWSPSLFEAL